MPGPDPGHARGGPEGEETAIQGLRAASCCTSNLLCDPNKWPTLGLNFPICNKETKLSGQKLGALILQCFDDEDGGDDDDGDKYLHPCV